MAVVLPAAAGPATAPLPGCDPVLADKVGYIATTWAMLAYGSWDPGAACQLTTFVAQLAAELVSAADPGHATDLRVLCELLGTGGDQPPSPERITAVTRALTALSARVLPVAAPLRERSISG